MLYYSHVNEDNRVEREIMRQGQFSDLWCIAGSGERVIGLMDIESLKHIYAVDINPEALYLLELKLTALQYLTVDQYLAFVGMLEMKPSSREAIFNNIGSRLSNDCFQYWEGHSNAIGKGVLQCGHFEGFLRRIRPLLHLSLGKGFYECFEHPLPDCKRFPQHRWRWLKKIFTYRWPYQLLGNRDDAFIAEDAQRQVIPNALQEVLDRGIVERSFMFHLVFKGHLRDMAEEYRPPSLQTQVLQKIKAKLEANQISIHYHCGDLLAVWKATDFTVSGSAFFSLSDLLSFVDFNYVKSFCESVLLQAGKGSFFVLRAFLRHQVSEKEWNWLKDHFTSLQDLSEQELTTMYQVYAFGDGLKAT